MDVAASIRQARQRAGLSQTALAGRAGTSQATISAYESGRKQPSVDTLERLLAAAGERLTTERAARAVVRPSQAQLQKAGRTLVEVLGLAEALPSRRAGKLRFPRLPEPTSS
jgi:transcriptional regulator with XRE-family HTH domain